MSNVLERSVAFHHGDDDVLDFLDEETREFKAVIRKSKEAMRVGGARLGGMAAATENSRDETSDEEPILGLVRRTSQCTRSKGPLELPQMILALSMRRRPRSLELRGKWNGCLAR
jgi:hypothetical protein